MIHLGQLLKGEEKPPVTRPQVVIFDDHKEILYHKASMMELDAAAQAKQAQLEEYKKGNEKRVFNNISNIVEEEMKFSKLNKLKLLADWRVVMRIAKIDELRKLIEIYVKNFERELDNKDAILQMLDRDIEEAEEHYSIALSNHFVHLKQLTNLQDSRIKGIFKEFDRDVSELENEFDSETTQIRKNFDEEQVEINNMLKMIKNEYNEKISILSMEFKRIREGLLSQISDKYTKLQEKIKKMAQNEVNKFSNEINDIKAKSKEKQNIDRNNIKALNGFERNIAMKKKFVDKLNEELKQCKIKIKQNNDDWEIKNSMLRKEKEKMMDSYKILKMKLIIFRNNQREKLKKLVKNSWDCILKLKEYIKLSEKIIKLAEICRRLETEREKILPYYENSDVIQDDIALPDVETILGIDPKMYEEIESLKNFWKRYNKVLLDVIAIKKQKSEIEKQNEILRSMLQQYYDGFTVNNLVMTNENPLLIVDNKNTLSNVIEEHPNQTIQEANFLFCDLAKQFNFNLINK